MTQGAESHVVMAVAAGQFEVRGDLTGADTPGCKSAHRVIDKVFPGEPGVVVPARHSRLRHIAQSTVSLGDPSTSRRHHGASPRPQGEDPPGGALPYYGPARPGPEHPASTQCPHRPSSSSSSRTSSPRRRRRRAVQTVLPWRFRHLLSSRPRCWLTYPGSLSGYPCVEALSESMGRQGRSGVRDTLPSPPRSRRGRWEKDGRRPDPYPVTGPSPPLLRERPRRPSRPIPSRRAIGPTFRAGETRVPDALRPAVANSG